MRLELEKKYMINTELSPSELLVIMAIRSKKLKQIKTLNDDYVHEITHLNKSMIKKTINKLIEKNILCEYENYYFFTDVIAQRNNVNDAKKNTVRKRRHKTNKITCKDTKEIANNYDDYLKTKHWDKMKNKIRIKYDYTCQKCHKSFKNNVSKLHVHHLTYRHIGDERTKDLTLLCDKCHSKIHKK